MWGAVCQSLEFPSCGMMSQTWYYCSLFLCISFPLFWSSIVHVDGAYGQGWITAKWDPHAPKFQGKERQESKNFWCSLMKWVFCPLLWNAQLLHTGMWHC